MIRIRPARTTPASEGQDWNGSACVETASGFTWAEALQRAESTRFAGHSDWRLPNVKELQSLVEECRSSGPWVHINVFPDTPSSWFCSSSPFAANPANAWGVHFSPGGHSYNYDSRSYNYHVRLARGGQWFGLFGELTGTIEPAAAR